MSVIWTNAEIEGEEVLWKIQHRDYHKKDVRKNAFIRLGDKMSKPVTEVTKKVTNLRTYYNKELAKEKKSRVSGSGSDEVYHSKWPFYDTIGSFLRDQVMPRKGMSNMDADSEEENEMETGDEDEEKNNDSELQTSATQSNITKACTPPVGKATDRLLNRKHQLKAEDTLLRDASFALKTLSASVSSTAKAPKDEDDDDIYGKYIATEMRRIKDAHTKQLIKNIKYKAFCLRHSMVVINLLLG